MSKNYSRLIAGDNIYLERKNDETIIHCSAFPSPLKNFNAGFFCLKTESDEHYGTHTVISNCIFRLNGQYHKLENFIINNYFKKYNYLCLDLEKCAISHFHYDDAENTENFSDDAKYILLYKIIYQNQHVYAESFAAGGLIDTIYGGEGFLFLLKDGSIKHTATKISGRLYDEFHPETNLFYIPCFNASTREALNICIPDNKGGILEIGKNENYHIWNATGYPSAASTVDNITVKISSDKVFF